MCAIGKVAGVGLGGQWLDGEQRFALRANAHLRRKRRAEDGAPGTRR
jgi:hypothetical protein